ncbi:Ig-like domain-containing protein [Saccharothrix texasensis]|uniref:Ig-like domain-containing protein n=1 Tax=Saccharothrix texasensis TaxID=103734 RepID=A0A3N1H4E4_9PSEU|nr:Ig-like domain-containing protein [Saccharothrix texasensis]ROP37092.1 Ig-like domain-containing protein [Saccharothrix texasensis]
MVRSLVVAALLAGAVTATAPSPAEARAEGTAPVGVSVELSTSPVPVGTAVRATAVVDPTEPDPTEVGGTVRFTVDGTPVGNPVALVGGQATAVLPPAAVGAHRVGAVYGGDQRFAAGDAGPGAKLVVTPAGSSRFVALPPARVLDTRDGTGRAGGRPAAGTTVRFHPGVPGGATAVALNVTVTDAAGPGHVTAWSGEGTRPATSNLNVERAGDTIANLVVVPLSAGGDVGLHTTTTADLIADVAGYFVTSSSATAGRLAPLTPARLADTRTGPRPAAGATITVRAAGVGGVPPAGAAGVVLNVTATEVAGPGHVTVWPADRSRPTASNLNTTRAGQTIPNAVWAPLSADGSVNLFTSAPAHLVVDVAGWFTGETAGSGTAGLFVPTTPTRLLDTRPDSRIGYQGGKPVASGAVVAGLAGRAPVPAGAAAVVANVTVTEAERPGHVTVHPGGTARPTASSLNIDTAGQTRPNLVTVPLGGGAVELFPTAPTHLVLDVAGYFTADLDPDAPATSHEDVAPAASTVVLDPPAVTALTATTVTLAAGVARPAVGAGLVLRGGGALAPQGRTGTVTAVASGPGGTTVATLAAAPLERLYDRVDIAYDGPADLLPPTPAATTRGVGVEVPVDESVMDLGRPGAFTCSSGTGTTLSAALVRFDHTRVRFEQRFGPLTAPFMHVSVETEPVVRFAAEFTGKVTCELSPAVRDRVRLVWRLPTSVPITVDLAPVLRFEASAAVTADLTVRLRRMVGFETNPDLSLRALNSSSHRNEGTSLSGQVAVSVLMGADVSVKVLDIAGVGFTIGPQFTAALDTSGCLTLSVAMRFELDVRVDLLFIHAKKTLISIVIGPWTLLTSCQGGSAGPLRVAVSTLPLGFVGKPYRATLTASGGAAPYTWQVSSGPAWLRWDDTGHLGGTPTAPGGEQLWVQVTDAAGAQRTTSVQLVVATTGDGGAELLSVTPSGAPGNAAAGRAMIGADGRFAYFESAATDLTASPLTRQPSVFVRDRVTRTTTRIDPPGDTGARHELRAISTNGRYSLIHSTLDRPQQSAIWRHDLVTGASTRLVLADDLLAGSTSRENSISDDGDVVYLGYGRLVRLSTQAVTQLRCPASTTPIGDFAHDVRFAGDASSVFFISDRCGQAYDSGYRFDTATGAAQPVLHAWCGWNAGSQCLERLVPTAAGDFTASLDVSSTQSALYIGAGATPVRSPLVMPCGLAEDSARVAFLADSTLLPGGDPRGWDLYSYNRGANAISRVAAGAGCTTHSYAGRSNEVAYVHDAQVYVRPVP